METYELENQVAAGLMSNTELRALLPAGSQSIYRLQAPSVLHERYPILVYRVISDVPALSGDNIELEHRVTVRIHVIGKMRKTSAEKTVFLQTCLLVKEIMTELDFRRVQTTPYVDDNGREMSVMDFVKNI